MPPERLRRLNISWEIFRARSGEIETLHVIPAKRDKTSGREAGHLKSVERAPGIQGLGVTQSAMALVFLGSLRRVLALDPRFRGDDN